MTYVADAKRYDEVQFSRCGRSGIVLPPVSVGLWQNFGGADVFETGRAVIRRAFDRGVTHFDLANNYGPPYGSAEENFGQILRKDFRPYRNELVISTKAGWDMWPGPYGIGASRKYLLASLDESLQRMGLEYVDIFYSHRPWLDVPLEETMGALVQAVHQGKALYVGISSYSPERTREAAAILKSMGVPLLIHQPSYSMLNRWVEGGLLATLEELGVGCIAFSPLAQGLLTSKYLNGVPENSRANVEGSSLLKNFLSEENLKRVRALNDIARGRGQTLAQMAIAWVLRDRRVTTALIGARNVQQLDDSLDAVKNLKFSDAELAEIDRYAVDGSLDLWKGAREGDGVANRLDWLPQHNRALEALRMRTTPLIASAWLCMLGVAPLVPAQVPVSRFEAASAPGVDSDHDGVSDELEQALLTQFAPAFMVSRHDCANVPALFTANLPEPVPETENGTIYGQVVPVNPGAAAKPAMEIHYYHLWKEDCGHLGHELDAEHVSAFVLADDGNPASTKWKAAYWYAAAHEDTVCDASQISRASTLHAEDRGPKVWISTGKHASFLNEQLCGHGCGGDNCEQMVPLSINAIVNLGERGTSMNGAIWSSSQRWPLKVKMARSDFKPAPVARLENLPATDIAWANPPKRPVQATIAVSDTTFGALATGNRKTDTAISTAEDATGNALDTTYTNVKHALGRSVQGVGNFLRGHPRSKPAH